MPKKRKGLKGEDKIRAVMGEFKRGTLHSGSGEIVTDRKQAIAIAMSEAGKSKKDDAPGPSAMAHPTPQQHAVNVTVNLMQGQKPPRARKPKRKFKHERFGKHEKLGRELTEVGL